LRPGRACGQCHLFELAVPSQSNTSLVSHLDCPGGGQVWIDGTTLYIAHWRRRTERPSSTFPIRAVPAN
jgi:hypothetical protein